MSVSESVRSVARVLEDVAALRARVADLREARPLRDGDGEAGDPLDHWAADVDRCLVNWGDDLDAIRTALVRLVGDLAAGTTTKTVRGSGGSLTATTRVRPPVGAPNDELPF